MTTIPNRAGAIPALALAGAFLPASATALDIYSWVNENGVVHYSESAPEVPVATPVVTLHIASTNSPGYDPDGYYWSILNQAERIGEQWSAIQEEKAAEQAEARAAAAEARIAELERQLAAGEAADYVVARPIYGPFAFFPKRHHLAANRGQPAPPDRAPRLVPRSDRDLRVPTDTRPGWTPPRRPAVPPEPGFSP